MMKSSWSDCRTIDPSELEARYSTEDSFLFMENFLFEPQQSEESKLRLERVQKLLEGLPNLEADFFELYFFKHLTQTNIAQIFKVSQPTVHYRLQRATDRIRFVLSLPDISVEEVEEAMRGFLSDPEDVRIMTLMFETTCQSDVAKQLGVTQGKVRHRFMRSTKRMSENPKMEKYAKVFSSIADNLNIKREVQRPSWDSKVSFVID
jgi:DNA-directed RNA polymerase specialized sigma24 family protein